MRDTPVLALRFLEQLELQAFGPVLGERCHARRGISFAASGAGREDYPPGRAARGGRRSLRITPAARSTVSVTLRITSS